ncbi:hypothetical protein AB8A31_00625 [Tardiphaga sp. 804_B3_N1_9]|uniref:hypothetical protein n=1 Tax=Tardiphaga TaxID=1395974 RepID=UPI0015861EDA|nr:hypothetical protein [Tardiphaga robiniae]NUU44628.1 hypothetical protein [Tardiphaga robiniae]
MGVVCGWGAIVFAIGAAALWFWASKVTVTAPPVDSPGDPEHPNDMIWVDSEKGMQIVTQAGSTIVNVLETVRAQSRWNSYAALAAATSATLQAVALYMSPMPPG